LTAQYNQSFLETYNFGYSGATVDLHLIDSGSASDMVSQVEETFLPTFDDGSLLGNPNDTWTSSNAAFGVWFGVNDVRLTYAGDNISSRYDTVFSKYGDLLEELYDAGARNFFLLNAPAIQYARAIAYHGSDYQQLAVDALALWIERVKDVGTNLATDHKDATVFYYDTYELFLQVIEDPTRYDETADLQSTTTYCELYEE
jgi:hypothetical protein